MLKEDAAEAIKYKEVLDAAYNTNVCIAYVHLRIIGCLVCDVGKSFHKQGLLDFNM